MSEQNSLLASLELKVTDLKTECGHWERKSISIRKELSKQQHHDLRDTQLQLQHSVEYGVLEEENKRLRVLVDTLQEQNQVRTRQV